MGALSSLRRSDGATAANVLGGRPRRVASRAGKAFAERLGFLVLERGPSSPAPDAPLGDARWSRRSPLAETAFDLDAQLAFIGDNLAPYIEQFGREVRAGGFKLWNNLFQAGDAEILYALLRHLKPRRVVEIGSGNSTLVSAAACAANAREGTRTNLVAIDPEPRVDISGQVEGLARFERVDCREVPLERYEQLEAGDVLFIDTTHVVKLGSEVNWLILDVLPRIAPGVWVHFHDIFLPDEYPWHLFFGQLPSEQYLLEAFLIGNDWTIELSLAALFGDRRDELLALVPSLREEVPGVPELKTWPPSSFWMRRRAR